jgi:hypothetical protein
VLLLRYVLLCSLHSAHVISRSMYNFTHTHYSEAETTTVRRSSLLRNSFAPLSKAGMQSVDYDDFERISRWCECSCDVPLCTLHPAHAILTINMQFYTLYSPHPNAPG